MTSVSTILAPLIFGLLLITALNRAAVFWYQEKSPRIFFSAMIFLTLCLLYLASSLMWSVFWREVVRVLMVLSLVLGNYYEWHNLRDFVRKKNAKRKAEATEKPNDAAKHS